MQTIDRRIRKTNRDVDNLTNKTMSRMNEEKVESNAKLAEVEAEKLRLSQIAQLVEVIHE